MIRFVLLFLLLFNAASFAAEPIQPLPKQVKIDKTKAQLGRKLFEDPILSKDKTVACVACHSFNYGGADPRNVSIGIDGKKGNIQAPTVYNARYNFKQFWNGRADSLGEQANGPIHNPVEMGLNSTVIEKRLNADSEYRKMFRRVYGTPRITYTQAIDAIVEFEKGLVTPNSRFDRYLRGEAKLGAEELEGYRRFKAYGCVTCHNGINIGGNSFQKMGLFVPYKRTKGTPDRYAVTKKGADRNVFKVPTLRNIALTAPYFHDASAKTLMGAIRTMSHHNLGTDISEEDAKAIVAFLKTLTGETPKVLQ